MSGLTDSQVADLLDELAHRNVHSAGDLRRFEAALRDKAEREARAPLEARVAALEAALSTCGDYIVGLGLPCGTRLVWETEYLALLGLIDRLVTKPHGWLAALAQPAPAEEK